MSPRAFAIQIGVLVFVGIVVVAGVALEISAAFERRNSWQKLTYAKRKRHAV
jgi:hypothetical protein